MIVVGRWCDGGGGGGGTSDQEKPNSVVFFPLEDVNVVGPERGHDLNPP